MSPDITLRDSPNAPVITGDNLYAVDGLLHYNGRPLGLPDSLVPPVLDTNYVVDTILPVQNGAVGIWAMSNFIGGLQAFDNGSCEVHAIAMTTLRFMQPAIQASPIIWNKCSNFWNK